MIIGRQRRLDKLEQASDGIPRIFTVWNDGNVDIELERDRLRTERGMRASEAMLFIRWLTPQDSAASREVQAIQ